MKTGEKETHVCWSVTANGNAGAVDAMQEINPADEHGTFLPTGEADAMWDFGQDEAAARRFVDEAMIALTGRQGALVEVYLVAQS